MSAGWQNGTRRCLLLEYPNQSPPCTHCPLKVKHTRRLVCPFLRRVTGHNCWPDSRSSSSFSSSADFSVLLRNRFLSSSSLPPLPQQPQPSFPCTHRTGFLRRRREPPHSVSPPPPPPAGSLPFLSHQLWHAHTHTSWRYPSVCLSVCPPNRD